jgi:hypothetical protein
MFTQVTAATLERAPRRSTGPSARWSLALICAAAAALLVVLGSRLSFFNDDWWFLLQRPGIESHGGLDVVLAPHNGNMVVLPAAVYKALAGVFGLGSQVPFRVAVALAAVCLGALVYSIVAQRLGSVAGLAAAAVVLFLGPAWEALLFIGASNHVGALIFGLAALVAIERDTPGRNALACGLLVAAVATANTGLAFVVGAAVAVLLRRRPVELWVPAVPAALFGLWWAAYGHRQPSNVTLAHIEQLPRYVFNALGAGLAAITGTQNHSLPGVISSGDVLAVLALGVVIWWLVRGGRPSAWAIAVASTLVAFWLLAGASAIQGRGPATSRYQVVDSVLLIVLVAELLRGRVLGRRTQWALGAVAVVVVAANLVVLRQGYDFLRVQSAFAKADLGALQIARPLAPPNFWLLAPVAQNPYLSGVTAQRYFAETNAHGAPAVSSAPQIASAPVPERHAADAVLAAAYAITPRPTGASGASGRCRRLTANGSEVALTPGRVAIRNLGAAPLVVGVRRFAPHGTPVDVGFLAAHSQARLQIPPDQVTIPWRITVRNPKGPSASAVDVCQSAVSP